ncbi:MAG: PepSY domain-containing protein [Pseudomonas sp.]|jgi:uncharacterized membrane protein YkoI|nr:PepSY domain-containing protein [Pseudomonas sp.]
MKICPPRQYPAPRSHCRGQLPPASAKRRRNARTLYAVLCALLFSCTATARDIHQNEALRLRESGQILPLEQLLDPVLRRYPGARLLDIELEEKKNTLVYEVELVTTQGVVRELKINARDGQILEDEED